LHLDTAFLKKRRENFEEKLKAVKYYMEESSVCRTRLLVKYFGENIDTDCGICDVCTAKKKEPLSKAEFSKIASALENELKQAPIAMEQLKAKLNLNNEDFKTVMDFLVDAGKIQRAAKATLKWVD